MLVALSGIALSGKDTTAELLSKKLGLPAKYMTMKTLAKERGVDILEFEQMIKSDTTGKWDRELDSWVKKNAKDCIMTAMLAAYDLPHADIRVFLYATEEERARRAMSRDSISKEKALQYLRDRDTIFRERIKRVYGIDWWDHQYYDVCINTGKYRPEQVVDIILKALGE